MKDGKNSYMSYNDFFDQTDERGVTNRDKIARLQHIIRRVSTTSKDVSFEAAEGSHDGVVAVDGKLVGFCMFAFSPELLMVMDRGVIYVLYCSLTSCIGVWFFSYFIC